MKKRLLSMLLALTLVLCAVPAVTASADDFHAEFTTHQREGYECIYYYDFESWEDSADWWKEDGDGDGIFWGKSCEESFTTGYEGTDGAYSMSYSNAYGQLSPDNWLYSPAFYVEPGTEISFLLSAFDSNVPGDHVGIYICTGDTSSPEYFTINYLDDFTAEGYWVGYTYGLDDYAGQTVRFAFCHDDWSDHYGVMLDCFNIWYPVWQMGSGVGNHSAWAGPELADAFDLDLIPDCLLGVDLTRNITRAEFAALAVEFYEQKSGRSAPGVGASPFVDTQDEAVLQAYELGIVEGVGGGRFDPYGLLTREQASTMMTRAYLLVLGDEGVWYETPAPYRDDYRISGWAREAVYLMTGFGVLGGMGNGTFAPQNHATREQGICIALRGIELLP